MALAMLLQISVSASGALAVLDILVVIVDFGLKLGDQLLLLQLRQLGHSFSHLVVDAVV